VKEKTNHTQAVSEKIYVWKWRAKSPAKAITKLFIWIWISMVGSSLLAQPYGLRVVHWTSLKEPWGSYHINIAIPPLLLSWSAQEINCHIPFWHAAVPMGEKSLSRGKMCYF